MAEIQIERKSGTKWWLWALLAVIAIGAIWFLANTRVRTTTTAAAGGEVAPLAADVGAGAGAGAPVGAFLTWADSTRAAGAATVTHDFVATGIERLSGAIGVLAAGDSLAGSSVPEQVGALNRLAVQIKQDPEALSHADLVYAAFQSSAKLLGDIQQRRFPGADGAVAEARAAAEAVDKGRPLLDQRAQVERFFTQAAGAVRAMSA